MEGRKKKGKNSEDGKKEEKKRRRKGGAKEQRLGGKHERDRARKNERRVWKRKRSVGQMTSGRKEEGDMKSQLKGECEEKRDRQREEGQG